MWVIYALLDPDPGAESGTRSKDQIESGSETVLFSLNGYFTSMSNCWAFFSAAVAGSFLLDLKPEKPISRSRSGFTSVLYPKTNY